MIINGREMEIEQGITIEDLLIQLSLPLDRVVVEVNLKIIEKTCYSKTILSREDKVEIVRLVGGG